MSVCAISNYNKKIDAMGLRNPHRCHGGLIYLFQIGTTAYFTKKKIYINFLYLTITNNSGPLNFSIIQKTDNYRYPNSCNKV